MEFSIESVMSNLKVHLDPSSDQDLRAISHLFLERFKTCSLVLDNYGFYFANLFESTVDIQYFGLHLLEVFIKARWSDYQCDKKCIFRKQLLVYFTDSVKQWPIQNSILKNSFAKLLTEIGKRDWIAEWPTYLEELLDIVQNGQNIHYEIMLINLLRLSEDISTHIDPNISSKDKQLLSKLLHQSHVIIFKFFLHLTNIFNHHSLKFVQFNLLHLFLLSLNSFLNNASLHLLLCDDLAIIHLLDNILSVPQLRIISVEILIVLLKRKELVEKFPHEITLFFYKNIFTTIFNILQVCHFEMDSLNELVVQDYMFLKQVTELISVFTTTNMDFLLTVQLGDINRQHNCNSDELIFSSTSVAKVFFDILNILVFHPSQHVTLLSIAPLNFLFRSSVMHDPAMKAKRYAFLENLCQKLVINGDPNVSTHPACFYNKIDFSDKKEFKLFSSKYIHLISNCIGAVIKDDISFAEYFLITSFDRLIEQPFSVSTLNTGSLYLSWDVFTRYNKIFYMVVESIGGPISNFYTTSSYISHHLLGYQYDDFRTILHIIMTLKCIVSFIKFDESIIQTFILTIVKFLQLMPEKNDVTQTNLISIHRNTLFLFQKLIKISAPLVFPWFSKLYDIFRALRMELTIFNRALFLASLLLMNKQSNVDSQIRFISIEIMLHSDVVQFEFFQILCFSSISSFISFMGYDNHSQVEQHECLNRYKLYNSIRILLTFFDCYTHSESIPLGRMFTRIIQGIYIPLLHLFRNCINIRSPNFNIFLHPHFINLSKLCASEITSLGSHYAMMYLDVINDTLSSHESTSFLLLLHEASSRLLLKCFIYNQDLYNEAIVHLICENLFDFSTTNLICIKYLILHFLQSFIIFCPLKFYGCVLLPIIDNFVQKITDRLNNEWNSTYCQEEMPKMMNITYSNIENELLTTVSREILRFINFTLHFKPSKPYDILYRGVFSMQDLNEELEMVEHPVTLPSSEFNTFFNSHISHSQNSVNQLLKLSKHALTWKDYVCTHWATEFSTSLLLHHEFYHIDEPFIKETLFVILSEIKDQGIDPNTFHKLSVMLLAIINFCFLQSAFIFDVLNSLPNIPQVLLLDLQHAILNKETKRQAVVIKRILMPIINQERTH